MSDQPTSGGAVLAGWASVEITPTLPTWMGGYAARTTQASAVHDPLLANAFALGSATHPLILILCDIIDVHAAFVHEVRSRASARIPGSTVWVGATHTHSGPDMGGFVAITGRAADPVVVDRIAEGCVEAATVAVAAMKPAHFAWASGVIDGVATNRVHPGTGEEIVLDMLCCYDSSPSEGHAPSAILASFPCHATVLSAENMALSADLPGAFRRHLRDALGADVWVALGTGAAGDISTRHVRQGQGFPELERLGGLLADQARALLLRARPVSVSQPLIHSVTAQLDRKEIPPASELDAQLRTLESQYATATQAGRVAQARTLETAIQGIRALRRLGETLTPASFEAEIDVAVAGDLGIVTIPGELFNRLGADIRHTTGKPALLFGYTNGYVGYLPTREAYAQLDYEVLISPLAAGSGERLSSLASELLVR